MIKTEKIIKKMKLNLSEFKIDDDEIIEMADDIQQSLHQDVNVIIAPYQWQGRFELGLHYCGIGHPVQFSYHMFQHGKKFLKLTNASTSTQLEIYEITRRSAIRTANELVESDTSINQVNALLRSQKWGLFFEPDFPKNKENWHKWLGYFERNGFHAMKDFMEKAIQRNQVQQ